MRQAGVSVGLPASLTRVGWRYLWAHRWQSLLMIFGIALGVAVVISIDLANSSAARAFTLSTETVAGKATHQITAGPQGVADRLYTRLRLEQPDVVAAPVIDVTVTSPQLGSHPMQLMGIDPFADAPFRSFLGSESTAQGGVADVSSLLRFLTQPGAVLLSQPLADRFGLKPGSPLTILLGGKEHPAVVAGLLTPQNDLSARTLDGVIIADIATAQELTGLTGQISRIDLILNDEAQSSTLQTWLPAGTLLQTSAARSGTLDQMTAAFRLNLSALSLLALVVGMFLIYNTMTFSVVQRREWFGILRCLGVTRREIFLLVLVEAFGVGLIGALAGIGLGLLMGQVTVRMVTQTVNDLYFTTTVQPGGPDPWSLIKGAGMGLLTTLLTAALPAYEAASVPPRAALLRSGIEAKARASVGKAAVAAVGSGILALILFYIPSNSVILAFIGTLATVVAAALLSSVTLITLMRFAAWAGGKLLGFTGKMAARNLVNSLSRTAVAVAALMVAVAVIVGVGLMIDSFRYTVVVWLEQTLQGDIYVSAPALDAVHASATIEPAVVDAIAAWHGVARVDTLRSTEVAARSGPVGILATENPSIGKERLFVWQAQATPQTWAALQSGGVLLSEPLANRLNISRPAANAAGAAAQLPQIELLTGSGWRTFPIVGVYYDYSSSQGAALMSLQVYRQAWQDTGLTALAVRMSPGGSPDALARDLQDHLPGGQALVIRPNASLRADALAVFDRTFSITVALRLLATIVAFIGVLNSLLLLQLEKAREVGILRALGLTGRQLWGLVMTETGLMGLTAGLLAMPTGYILALILVFIINRRSFGWTLQLHVTPDIFVQAMGIALAASLLAGIYPAIKLGRMAAAQVMRYE